MIKSILTAVDNSNSSVSAIEFSAEFAKATGAKLKCLYVEDLYKLLEWQPTELIGSAIGATTATPHMKATEEQLEIEKEFKKDRTQLKEIFDTACKKYNVSGTFEITRDRVDDAIIKKSRTVDLVIIGKRGKTYPENSKEPGPIAEYLLRHISKPVFVIPSTSMPTARISGSFPLDKILVAYDSSEASQKSLSLSASLATVLKSEIEVISVTNDSKVAEEILKEAREFLEPYNLKSSFKSGTGAGMPWCAINEEAQKYNPGIIIIGAFGSNKLLELIFGSTTKQVLTDSTCPILLSK